MSRIGKTHLVFVCFFIIISDCLMAYLSKKQNNIYLYLLLKLSTLLLEVVVHNSYG